VTSGSLADLRRHTRTTVHAVTERAPTLDGIGGIANLEIARGDGRVEVRLSADASSLGDVVGRLHAARVDSLTVTPPSLDELFLHAYADGEDGR
jgi:ABC-2 type transport system ATP-binding protein